MRPYLLTFVDEKLETKYQTSKRNRIQRPIFYCFIVISFLANIMSIILNIIENKVPTVSIATLTFFLAVLFLIQKFPQLIQYSLLITNILLSGFQLLLDPFTLTNQEYYTYGCIFTLLQTVIYFISDFHLSLIQVIINLVTRVTITILLSSRCDYLSLVIDIAAVILISTTIYISDHNSRTQFLLTQKEDLFFQQTQYFINKPYSILSFNQKFSMFQVMQHYKINQFYVQIEDYCEGCNMREFLRQCFYKNDTLEELIISKSILLNECLTVRYLKQKIIIKICQYGYSDNYVVILEKGISNLLNKQISIPIKNVINQYFRNIGKEYYLFKLGICSALLINTLNQKSINVLHILQHLTQTFQLDHAITFKVLRSNDKKYLDSMDIITYANKFKIFFIQVFIILSQLLKNNLKQQMILSSTNDYIELRIVTSFKRQFLKLYSRNLFIEQTQNFILYEVVSEDLSFKLNKMISFTKNLSN